jgi:hypothetical protein
MGEIDRWPLSRSSGGSDWFAGDVHRTLWCFRRRDLLRMALCGRLVLQANGSSLTFESALGLPLSQPRVRLATPRSGLSNNG